MDIDPKRNVLEEYKFLREETRAFTNQSFRDLQLFLGILAVLFTLSKIDVSAGEEKSPMLIPINTFWYFMILQGLSFIFIVIQFLKVIYILTIRAHLKKLEYILNGDVHNDLGFQWESNVVPTELENNASYVTHGQFAIALVYFLFYSGLICMCFKYLNELYGSLHFSFFMVIALESSFIIYSIIRIYILRPLHWQRNRNRR